MATTEPVTVFVPDDPLPDDPLPDDDGLGELEALPEELLLPDTIELAGLAVVVGDREASNPNIRTTADTVLRSQKEMRRMGVTS